MLSAVIISLVVLDQLEINARNFTGVWRYFKLGDFSFLNAESLYDNLTSGNILYSSIFN